MNHDINYPLIQFQLLCAETVEKSNGYNENFIGEYFRKERNKTVEILNGLFLTISETEINIKQYESILLQDNIITNDFKNSLQTELRNLINIKNLAFLYKDCITYFYFYDESRNQDNTYFFNTIFLPQMIYTKNENSVNKNPEYIQQLIDKGFIDSDGETVIAKSLEVVAIEISNLIKTPLTKNHLLRFKQAGTNKPYSNPAIKKAINCVNT